VALVCEALLAVRRLRRRAKSCARSPACPAKSPSVSPASSATGAKSGALAVAAAPAAERPTWMTVPALTSEERCPADAREPLQRATSPRVCTRVHVLAAAVKWWCCVWFRSMQDACVTSAWFAFRCCRLMISFVRSGRRRVRHVQRLLKTYGVCCQPEQAGTGICACI
jgi:hypothetical protein